MKKYLALLVLLSMVMMLSSCEKKDKASSPAEPMKTAESISIGLEEGQEGAVSPSD